MQTGTGRGDHRRLTPNVNGAERLGGSVRAVRPPSLVVTSLGLGCVFVPLTLIARAAAATTG